MTIDYETYERQDEFPFECESVKIVFFCRNLPMITQNGERKKVREYSVNVPIDEYRGLCQHIENEVTEYSLIFDLY